MSVLNINSLNQTRLAGIDSVYIKASVTGQYDFCLFSTVVKDMLIFHQCSERVWAEERAVRQMVRS